jgi:DNA helicase IV
MPPETLAEEQQWFEDTTDRREFFRAGVLSSPEAAADPKVAGVIRKAAQREMATLGNPDEPVAIGRIDDIAGEVLYVGYHAILDENKDVLVINWKMPAAVRFYQANATDSQGLVRKRTYTCDGPKLRTFEEAVFAEIAERLTRVIGGEEIPDDALLRDLERSRTGEMREIVQTIQAAQDSIVRTEPRGALIVQGGPGTGKTAVALHRVSWLLFTYADTMSPEDVLVVGPSPVFTRYIRQVLPSLGDKDVRQLAIGQLGPEAPRGGSDDEATSRIKGDTRMAELISRAARQRVRIPQGEDALTLAAGGETIRFSPAEIQEQTDTIYSSTGFNRGRLAFKTWLTNTAAARVAGASRRGTASTTDIDNFVERVWPQLSPAMLLQDLLGSRERLLTAAGDLFSAAEIVALYRQAAPRVLDEKWTDADVCLLDECSYALGDAPATFRHIVVDEAQDLSPMQFRSIKRRSSSGELTLVGDIAQSTSTWARDSWDDVVAYFGKESSIVELEIGWRVPAEVFALAAKILPLAAPNITPPRIIRESGIQPLLVQCQDGDQALEAVKAARDAAGRGCSVGMICPDTIRQELEDTLRRQEVAWEDGSKGDLGKSISVLRPEDAKGLEFDAVVIIEPQDIVNAHVHGHRMLYVALTRTIKYLYVIHHGAALPGVSEESHADAILLLPLDPDDPSIQIHLAPEAERQVTTPTPRNNGADRIVKAIASDLAEQIAENVPAHLWPRVLEALIDAIDDKE